MIDDPKGRAPRRLADALREQPDPPCEACRFSTICTAECRQFAAYVQTGKRIEPPREFPG